jgi:hypothetical protein
MYERRPLTLRPNVPLGKPTEAEVILRGYYAHMAAVDDCLARLLAQLERQQIAEDTIVIFTSDHGDMMLSQGLTTKLYPWDESLRVPFLLRYPRKFSFSRSGRRMKTPLNIPDAARPERRLSARQGICAACRAEPLSRSERSSRPHEESADLVPGPSPPGSPSCPRGRTNCASGRGPARCHTAAMVLESSVRKCDARCAGRGIRQSHNAAPP